MKSKTLATWLAFLGGPLGLHRFYLHGARDLLGWLLPLVDFNADLPGGIQSVATQDGIKALLVGIPLVGVALALWLVLKFPLTAEKVAEVRAQLEKKRGKI